jgi:dipeptidase E
MNLLLLSNSRTPEGGYLGHALQAICEVVAGRGRIVFFPFAGVTTRWSDYTELVRAAFLPLGLPVASADDLKPAATSLNDSDVIFIGGGNTFRLLAECRQREWLEVIRTAVRRGIPYIGSSAGSVIACPSIQTTNDMPIIDPGGLGALGLVPFQLNCHFTDFTPPGHQGETRRQRISEFLTLHPDETVIGLPEGDWIRGRNDNFILQGPHPAWQFQLRRDAVQLSVGDALGLG